MKIRGDGRRRNPWRAVALTGACAAASISLVGAGADPQTAASHMQAPPGAQPPTNANGEKPEFPPFDKVTEDLEKVVSTADGEASFWTLYADEKTGRLVAELPRQYEQQLFLIAPTVAAGDENAGVMGGTFYAKWKRYDKKLALVSPNFLARGTGEAESDASVEQLYTGSVIAELPILTMGPGGGPVIDLEMLLAKQNSKFFPPFGPTAGLNPGLVSLVKAKAFPENLEITYEMPNAGGRLITVHYSIRHLPENKSFTPREADDRVGYFNVYYMEPGRPETEFMPVKRYITRWQIEKADPSRQLSPPKEPIVWYIEHTTPIRFRRWVREGIESWNDAFEEIGIVNAVQVYQQDATTGAHMEKDPEDARYNFFRWNTSNQGYAIGPSRVDPRTGQIVDADVVWHAGLTRAVMSMHEGLTGDIAVQGFGPETLDWLAEHPEWDPRVRLAPPEKQRRLLAERRAAVKSGRAHEGGLRQAYGGVHTDEPGYDESLGRRCQLGEYMAMNIGLYLSALDGGIVQADPEGDTLDGVPEEFLGPMVRYISAHEVGHCMGLQHNFGASTIRTLEEINSGEMDDDEPFVASVMEYAGPNITPEGEPQGPYATPTVGPYDKWAIAYGYGDADKTEDVLAEVSDPDHVFLNDIAAIGPDPRAQTWDMGANQLDFVEMRMEIVQDLRDQIVSEFVDDGETWEKTRDRYQALLNNHLQAVVIANRWIGGSYVHNDRKGDPGDRKPIENVDSDKQRRALNLVIANTFEDEAYGVTPELLHHMGLDVYYDAPGFQKASQDPAFPVHDQIGGLQATALTLLMNPTKLRRIYDNEYRMADDPNPLTLAEAMDTITSAAWRELEEGQGGRYTAADPMVSSFRRNLQREHLERLISLTMLDAAASPSTRTISTLAVQTLRDLGEAMEEVQNDRATKLDPYTRAHLTDAQARIDKALDAEYVYNR